MSILSLPVFPLCVGLLSSALFATVKTNPKSHLKRTCRYCTQRLSKAAALNLCLHLSFSLFPAAVPSSHSHIDSLNQHRVNGVLM